MKTTQLRLYSLFMTIVFTLQSWAQKYYKEEIDDDDVRTKNIDEEELEPFPNYFDDFISHISCNDIIFIFTTICAILVFRKIWKGCSYLIVMVALLFYFLSI